MHELTNDELLSAYLDGELTADEQARAEQLIATDEQARKLFDELRGMRSCLQGLPRQTLPIDFATRVVRSAERETLVASPPSTTEPMSPPAWQDRIRRPLAYAAMVLAASLLIAIFNPDAQREAGPQTVAIAPKDAPPAATAPPSAPFGSDYDPPSMSAAPGSAPAGESRSEEGERAPFNKLADGRGFGAMLEPAGKGGGALGLPVDGLIARPESQGVQPDAGLLVVTCEITPKAAKQDSFRQVLIRNQISLDDAMNPQHAQNQPLAPAAPKADRENAQKQTEVQSDLELVYVQATTEQLEATLADMATKSTEFLSVDVGPLEQSGVQNRWREQYGFGRGGMTQQRFVNPPALVADAVQQPQPTTPATEQAQTSRAKPAANESPPDEGVMDNRQQKLSGRARAYSMPSDNPNNQRAAPPVMLQQQQPSQTAGGAGEKKLQQQGDNPQPPAEAAGAPAKNPVSQEPGTRRALFVLRVAEEPAPPAEKK